MSMQLPDTDIVSLYSEYLELDCRALCPAPWPGYCDPNYSALSPVFRSVFCLHPARHLLTAGGWGRLPLAGVPVRVTAHSLMKATERCQCNFTLTGDGTLEQLLLGKAPTR